ncbi:hypothetical protein BCR36DRAFT_287623 [Piromyces finnis]|uniref:Uncharacterized protein n=1 Tax=Piromyces finnis TaxID=1754191 RepID=A0A1Y1VB75_9FUNG|nr:hypothetical protein BCR36DRAFT_287623 [Piromyces finnis]|eukprot:ORX51810.1 hypothetical protein BCR36DRAFT_287623 [Piromyces finnis]
MDKLCIWMTLDQFPAFDSVNTLDNELSDDKITNFVNCILKELFNKDLPKIIKHLYTKVSGGFEEEDPKSNLLSPKFKEKMLKSREKYKIQKPQKIQSLSEKLREESQSLTTNKMAGKNFFNRLFKDREVVIVKKESKHKKKNKKNLVVKEPKETTTVPKQLLPFDEDEEEEVKMVLKPRKTFNSMSILSNLMLTPRKRRNKNELLKNITKSPYKMSNWITKNDPLPLQSKKPNTTSEFIVFAPKTPSKKNKKSRNNVYFVNNTNGQPLDTTTTTDKNKSDSMEFKVCQTPMVPKRSQSMIMEERKGISLVRSQSLLEELNSIAAADDKENGNSNANRMTSISPQDKDTSMDSAKLEIKNLFKASFSQNNILSKSYSFNIGTTTSTTVDKKEKESNFSFDIKSLYDSYLTNRSQSSNDSPNDHRFNIFSRSYHRRNSEEEESNRSGESITFRKWLPKDINDPSDESSHEKTPPIAHDQGSRKTSKNEDSTHFNGLDDLEQLKHHYSQHSATENRRISFSPSPSPTPMSYSREISRSPTFNKLNRNSSFTLGLDSQPSFLDFTTTTQEGESIFPSATNHAITTTPKADRRTSFINFNPRAFDISSEGSSSGGGGGDGPSPTPSAPTTNQTFIFQKPWSRHQTLTESPTQATAKEEEIMRTPSKRKLKQSLPMFSFSSPGMKRKNSSFGDNDFPSSSKVSPSPTSSTHSTLSKIGDEDPSHYLKVPILSTPKKRRLNLLKVTNTKSPTMDQNYLAPTAPFSSQDSIDNTGLDVVMTTPSKKYNIFTVAPTPTKYTSLFD